MTSEAKALDGAQRSRIFVGLARDIVGRVLRDEEAAWGAVAGMIEEELRWAVNLSCTCGGRPPGPHACPACAVYHRMTGANRRAET